MWHTSLARINVILSCLVPYFSWALDTLAYQKVDYPSLEFFASSPLLKEFKKHINLFLHSVKTEDQNSRLSVVLFFERLKSIYTA